MALVLVCAALVIGGGCASPERTSYRVVGTVATTVDQAMQAWAEWDVEYPNAEVEAKVREVYGRYQEAARVARAAVIAWKTAPTETGWQRVEAAIDGLSAAAAEVVVITRGEGRREKGE